MANSDLTFTQYALTLESRIVLDSNLVDLSGAVSHRRQAGIRLFRVFDRPALRFVSESAQSEPWLAFLDQCFGLCSCLRQN